MTTTDTTDTTAGRAPAHTTLVLGGTGKTGRRVAAALRAAGRAVAIGSRSATPPFDWTDESTWPAVLAGVGSAYVAYSPDAGFPGAAEVIGRFARRAADTGVDRLVLLTGRNEEGALRSEEALRAAGTRWTVVRAAFFAQNFSEDFMVEQVRAGELAMPAADVPEPFVDADDVAEVAAAALLDEGNDGRVYEVTGPRLLTFTQALAEITAATGRPVAYRALEPGEYVAAMVAGGAPAELARPLAEVFTEILDGRNAHLGRGVQEALGREPRDFADYVARAAAGAWPRPAQAAEPARG
ncbi:NmrA family NAD(P)-binding protein [Streptomonospora nanhaiensis]|uniref:NmrA family NAD(P)-binding protein n=1 Tax=Streptomonospora nanhaiensis TaxID=1323731 RepID=UPI001C99FFAA|nr:NmrA family NAD(P)-binding protein [Streptomonospora nanhaiensis]MBX9387451.1 NmrA family NAD(P)-binding protein [Streptomonospora nanhaiensis]